MVHALKRGGENLLGWTYGYKLAHSKLDQADNLNNIMKNLNFGSLGENSLAGTTEQENITCMKEGLWEGWVVYSRGRGRKRHNRLRQS